MVEEAIAAQFTLYGTSACHLCEIAQQMLLQRCEQDHRLVFTKVDISESDELFERYGIRIPVLQHPDGRELDWPFTAQQLGEFTRS